MTPTLTGTRPRWNCVTDWTAPSSEHLEVLFGQIANQSPVTVTDRRRHLDEVDPRTEHLGPDKVDHRDE